MEVNIDEYHVVLELYWCLRTSREKKMYEQ